jgi:hypothetical protein
VVFITPSISGESGCTELDCICATVTVGALALAGAVFACAGSGDGGLRVASPDAGAAALLEVLHPMLMHSLVVGNWHMRRAAALQLFSQNRYL